MTPWFVSSDYGTSLVDSLSEIELYREVGMTPSDRTVGQIIEDAREAAGTTLRALSETTGIPLTSLHRLVHDQVSRPEPAHLVILADVLNVPRGRLLAAAGYPRPVVAESVDAALRRAYDLPDEAFDEIHAAVADVVERYADGAWKGETQ